MNKKTVVLYHANCLDGFSGAWAAWKKFGEEAEYIPVQYNKAYPENLEGKKIYFIDFVYPEETTKEIIKLSEKTVIIDHHKGAEETARMASDCYFSNDHSGAVLAWKYFHPDKKTPFLLEHIEDMDLWRFNLPNTKKAIAFIESKETSFENWDKLENIFENEKKLKKAVSIGKHLLSYKNTAIKTIAENAYPVLFEGFRILAVNSPIFESDLGSFLRKKNPPIGLVWRQKEDEIKVSLRSDENTDVSKMAAKYGGGGHKSSAGFKFLANKPFPWRPVEK